MEMEGRRHSNKGESKSSVVVVNDQESTIDWRGRPSNPHKHGGMRAATFVLGTSLFLSHKYKKIRIYLSIYIYKAEHARSICICSLARVLIFLT